MLEALAEEPSFAGLPIAPDALWDAGLQGLVASQHFVFGHDCLYPSDCQTLRMGHSGEPYMSNFRMGSFGETYMCIFRMQHSGEPYMHVYISYGGLR